MKIPPVQHSLCCKFLFTRYSISNLIKFSWVMSCSQQAVLRTNEFPYKTHFIITFLILSIAETADVLSIG